MEKIRCLFIDDQVKRIKEDISEWKKFSSGENLELFNSFIFEFKQSDVKTVVPYLIDECKGYDFIVLDQMAVSDEAGTQLAEGIGGYLNRENINYCIYTNQVGQETKGKFEKVNIYKKSEFVEEEFKKEHYCEGGFIDMLHHIKSNTGFNKYCRFLRFTNDQNLEELIRTKLAPLMNNYLEGGCKVIDNGHLLKFCDRLSEELINQGIVPDISYTNGHKGVNISNVINYLISPKDLLDKWIEEADPNNSSNKNHYAKMFFKGDDVIKITEKCVLKSVVSEVYLKRKKHNYNAGDFYFNCYYIKSVSDTFFSKLQIGDSFKSSLIGHSLDFIWTYRCSEGHEGQSDPKNHALKAVYESILLVCERLSIIFERIDELEKSAVDVEEIEPVSEIKEESAEEPKAEETPEAAIEEY